MPVTRGSGNPKWTWDETLLALDLLYRRGALDDKNPEVIGLSELLRAAKLIPIERRKSSFRNADGVSLKLQNLMSALDPNRALSASATDRAAVAAFPRSRAGELAEIADAVRMELKAYEPTANDQLADYEAVFIEGRILTAKHRSRDRRLRKYLLDRTSDHALTCAICDLLPPAALGRELRESFFEAHHLLPLAATPGKRATQVKDLALLCAGCHRFLHKLVAQKRSWLSIEEARMEFERPTVER